MVLTGTVRLEGKLVLPGTAPAPSPAHEVFAAGIREQPRRRGPAWWLARSRDPRRLRRVCEEAVGRGAVRHSSIPGTLDLYTVDPRRRAVLVEHLGAVPPAGARSAALLAPCHGAGLGHLVASGLTARERTVRIRQLLEDTPMSVEADVRTVVRWGLVGRSALAEPHGRGFPRLLVGPVVQLRGPAAYAGVFPGACSCRAACLRAR